MANTDGTYTTGQFAQLCGCKKQTLFHYDEIGLLKPACVKENGYRSYSHDQYQTYLLISCLKEVGMTLSEIKDYLEEEDADTRRRQLGLRIAALDKRISYLMNVRKILSSTFALDSAAPGDASRNIDEIRLSNEPMKVFWALGPLDELDDERLVEDIAALIKKTQPYAVAMSSDEIRRGVYDNQKYLLVPADERITEDLVESLSLTRFEIPAGRYAITDQQPSETPEDVYKRLDLSFDSFNESPGEYYYEIYPQADQTSDVPLSILVQIIPNDPDDDPFFH